MYKVNSNSIIRDIRISWRKIASLTIALMLSAVSVSALDLPVRTIKGSKYYCYKVESGETVYSITHKLGITHSQIVKYNPSVEDGLKAGQLLTFPVDKFGEGFGTVSGTINHLVKKGDTLFSLAGKYGVSTDAIIAENPGAEKGIRIGETLVIPVVVDNDVPQTNIGTTANPGNETTVSTIEVENPDALKPVKPALSVRQGYDPDSRELSVVVCLPFMLGTEKAPKTAVYATDFYRGMLIGIDSLRSQYGNPRIKITAIDSDDPAQPFNALTSQAAIFRAADVIIAPESIDRLEALGRFGQENKVYIFNTFQARDTTCLTNPYMIQGNILQPEMFDKVIDFFVDEYLDGATPVFLENERGAKDKQGFIDALTSRLIADNKNFKTLKYNGSMTSAAITEKLSTDSVDYVFVPISGSLNEFHKFGTALQNYANDVSSSVIPGRVRLFAYPEYTRFSGDSFEKLQNIGTTFYSRFYNDATSTGSEAIRNSFVKWYGTDLPEGVPNQALYGFDVSRWLLDLASRGSLTREDISSSVMNDGAQMTYKFIDVPKGGFVNESMFIVTLTPGRVVTTKVL